MTDLPSRDICDALVADPGIGVSIVDAEQTLLFINASAAGMYFDDEPEALVGRHLTELLPQAMVDESRALFAPLETEPGPLQVRDLWHGRQVLATTHRIPQPDDAPDHYLTLHRRVIGTPDTPEAPIPSAVIDLGPLADLSARELEVLALIGQGLIAKEIAGVLGCAPRTVDVHRQAIRRKLDIADRVVLARIAMEAGLRVDDAGRARPAS